MLSYFHMRNAFGDEDEVSELPCRKLVYKPLCSDPWQYRAHVRVQHAVRVGRLVPQPCEVCGGEPTVAHHQDYSKPLDVNWLCYSCHKYVSVAVRELVVIAEDWLL